MVWDLAAPEQHTGVAHSGLYAEMSLVAAGRICDQDAGDHQSL